MPVPEIFDEKVLRLLDGLPPGRLLGPCKPPYPVVWLGDGPLRDAADWWRRLYAQRGETGLYPLLLEYPYDSLQPASGPYGAGVDAGSWLRSRWRPDEWPPFEKWPGLARPAEVMRDPDVCAGEVATGLVRDGLARCPALVQIDRGADALAALRWRGMTEQMSAVLRSWEDRFGVRVVGLGHASLYLSVAGPPTEAHQARVLAAEHFLACPDVFFADLDLDWDTYHEELMGRHEWRFWWD
ncbi:DUF4253 domain-containing protein [Streptomyces sp. NPDC046939]|uniref:DUF4253 domain-containing protein n=1 Tax=Streptomyces sp. NPDC046939 TaxID=3155376 RepID=UPI0033DDE3E0